MKKDIHPQYGKATVTCACGETFETGSTKKEIRVRSAQTVIPFLPVNNELLIRVARWKNSKNGWKKPETS